MSRGQKKKVILGTSRVNSTLPGAQGKRINMLFVTFLSGGVPCDFSNMKYVPWLHKIGCHPAFPKVKLVNLLFACF